MAVFQQRKLENLMKNKLNNNLIVRNASWLIAGRIAQMAINFVIGLMTARYLGPSNYGLINYAAAYAGFFSSFCSLGINSVIVKELTDDVDKDGEIIGTALFLQIVSSVLSAIAINCIVFVADKGDPTICAVMVLSCIGMICNVFSVFNYWFQSRLQSKITAMATLVAYAITAVYKLMLLARGKSVVWFAFATAVDYICLAVFLLAAYKRYGGGRLRFSVERGKQLLRKSCHFILPGLMVAVYAQTDKIMLKQMISEAEIGYYSTAVSLCGVWCFVLSAIIDSLYPEIAKSHKTDRALFERRNKQLYAIVFYLSACVSLVIVLLAKPAVYILYGEAYMPTVAPLRVITWYTAFSYLGVARNAWIVCENRQRYLIWVYASAAVSNVLLNLVLIPRFGATGAAVASLTAQVVTTMIAPFFIKDLRQNAMLMVDAIRLKNIL